MAGQEEHGATLKEKDNWIVDFLRLRKKIIVNAFLFWEDFI